MFDSYKDFNAHRDSYYFHPKLGVYIYKDLNYRVQGSDMTDERSRRNIDRRLRELAPFLKDSEYHEATELTIAKICSYCIQDMNRFFKDSEGTIHKMYYDKGIYHKDAGQSGLKKNIDSFCELLVDYARENNLVNVEKQAQEYQKHVMRTKLMKDISSMDVIEMSELDSNPWLFAFQNEVYDMRCNIVRPFHPLDFLTIKSNIMFDPEAENKEFTDFLNWASQSDTSIADYLQTVFGSMLCGARPQPEFYILHSAERSGKGVFLSVINSVLGDYADNVDADILLTTFKKSSGHNEKLASLKNLRLAYMDEYNEHHHFNVNVIKRLTGGGEIRASKKFGHEVTFKPQFRMILMTNHLPVVENDDLFLTDRLVVIPFGKYIDRDDRDSELAYNLQKPEALSAVLNWLIAGFVRFQNNKYTISRPQPIVDEINNYRYKSCPERQFIKEHLTSCNTENIDAYVVFENCCRWLEDNKYDGTLATKNAFYSLIRKMGYEVSKGNRNMLMVKNAKIV